MLFCCPCSWWNLLLAVVLPRSASTCSAILRDWLSLDPKTAKLIYRFQHFMAPSYLPDRYQKLSFTLLCLHSLFHWQNPALENHIYQQSLCIIVILTRQITHTLNTVGFFPLAALEAGEMCVRFVDWMGFLLLWGCLDGVWHKRKGKFTLEQTMKAQRGSRGIALLFLWPWH